ncbi:hypothetical protein [Pseudomonas botevensis]|uniref:hypothetical protein n=1 Tax=Pseudomonas botevensis TaxID=2842352 RepID=UPI001C3DE105|nr:hypothetical protein [Pseudomonas botevensis]MBV4476078.1 hypothetical protein [Pseudomonas botevensis]
MSHTVIVNEDFETETETTIIAGQSITTKILKVEFLSGTGVVEIRKKNPPDIPGKIESNILYLKWDGGTVQEIKISPNTPCSTVSFWFDKWQGISDFYFYDGDQLLGVEEPNSNDVNNIKHTAKRITHFTFSHHTRGLDMDNFNFTS